MIFYILKRSLDSICSFKIELVTVNLLKCRVVLKNKGTKVITTSQAYLPKIIGYRAVYGLYVDFVDLANNIICWFIFYFKLRLRSKKTDKAR
jgi:hypothetical protein